MKGNSGIAPESQPRTLASWALGILDTLEQHGYSRSRVVEETGLALDDLQNPRLRLALTDFGKLWAIAVRELGEDAGLRVGSHFRLGNWQILGAGLVSSHSIADWVERITTYYRLVTDGVDFRLEDAGNGEVAMRVQFVVPVTLLETRLDCVMAAGTRMFKSLFGPDAGVKRIELIRKKPADPAAWERVLGPNIVWSAQSTRLIFDAARLNQPLPPIDPELDKSHRELLQRALQTLEQNDPVQVARRIILEQLPGGEPTLAQIAEKMHLSGRTLQRRLGEAGTHFSQLVDRIRERLACDYMEQGYSVGEVSYLLGFSEPSSFHAAFKRWTGMTPGDFKTKT